MRFTKMHGLGNDYIYVNCLMEEVKEPGRLAKKLSDRHFGVGADGLILVCRSSKADFRMEMYNADGSAGEMCGNGIRCLGKYVYEQGLTRKQELTVETPAGIRILRLRVGWQCGRKLVESVQVDMGVPILQADKIPIISENSRVIHEPFRINGTEYRVTGVSMGNPHAVIYVKSIKRLDLAWLGPAFEYNGRFPRRTNVEFVQVLDRAHVKVRVWERGTGETMACGTGACAVLVAGVLNGVTERQISIELPGGALSALWKEDTGSVLLTGPAVHVYDGETAEI